jgi:TRAP-type mannitol/chloroaromatic compound transport system permease large subunit
MLPGLMLAGMYMIYVIGRAAFNPSLAPKPREEDVPSFARILYELATSFVPLAVLILSVLGAILMGLATPAEAAGVGAFGGLVLAAEGIGVPYCQDLGHGLLAIRWFLDLRLGVLLSRRP